MLASGDNGATWTSHAPRIGQAVRGISTGGNAKLIVGGSALRMRYVPVP